MPNNTDFNVVSDREKQYHNAGFLNVPRKHCVILICCFEQNIEH